MIECKDTAFDTFLTEAQKRKLPFKVLEDHNKLRHKLVEVQGERIYLTYKRDFFNTFCKQFPDYCANNGVPVDEVGESINKESLDYALQKGAEIIVFCHPEGEYWQYINIVKKYCVKYNLIRRQDVENIDRNNVGKPILIKEETYSFPKRLLKVNYWERKT